ncbi:monocarboxylate transporter 12-like isoform X2 [Ptychodera flava]|uniref:monocarboxylate transporter 12-like isoform X2 n=1 Tax=Ptychodera flava TaxID=63121 RepID=UPI00396A0C13
MVNCSLVGFTVSKYGVRKVVLFSAILHCAAIGLSVFAESVPHLIVTFGILNGIGLSVASICGYTIVGEYFRNGYAFANGLSSMGARCGAMALPPLTVLLIEKYGWHGALVIFTGFSANMIVCATAMKAPFSVPTLDEGICKKDTETQDDDRVISRHTDSRELRKMNQSTVESTSIPMTKDVNSEMSVDNIELEIKQKCLMKKCALIYRLFGFHLVRRYPLYGVLNLSIFFYGVYIGSNPVWIVVRAVAIGIPRIDAATLLTYTGACGMASRFLHGWFIDRGVISPFTLLTLMMATKSIANIVLTFTTNYAIMVISCVFLGIAQGVITPVYVVCARKLVEPKDHPSALGLLFAVLEISCVMIPVAGKIYDVTQDSRHPLFVTDAGISIGTILCAVVCVLQKRNAKSRLDLHVDNQEGTS